MMTRNVQLVDVLRCLHVLALAEQTLHLSAAAKPCLPGIACSPCVPSYCLVCEMCRFIGRDTGVRFTKQLAISFAISYIYIYKMKICFASFTHLCPTNKLAFSTSKETGSCKCCKKVEICKKYGFASLQIY